MAKATVKELVKSKNGINVNRFGGAPTPIVDPELAEALNKEARENFYDPAWQRQVAEDISSILDYGFTFQNQFSNYFLVQNAGEFDRVVLEERKGGKAYWTAKGGQIEETQFETETWEVPRDQIGYHVSEFDDKLRANFAMQLAELIQLGGARLETEVNRRIFQLLQAAIPDSSDYYVSGSGLAQSDLNAAIASVFDAVKPDGVGEIPITIMGRFSMVDQISDFEGFAYPALEEIRHQGFLGRYKGCDVRRLLHWTDGLGDSYMPANELWVFAGTVGRFVNFGSFKSKTWNEDDKDYTHYRSRKDCGGLINHPEQAFRIIDSSVDA